MSSGLGFWGAMAMLAFACPAADSAGSPSVNGPVDTVVCIADELPAMQVLADRLKSDRGVGALVVRQTELPADLSRYRAVVVYVHGKLLETTEMACIRYAETGGKLIALHHSISSGKRANRRWFEFLGVTLPTGDAASGGYQWTEGVALQIVNLAPRSRVTTRGVPYREKIDYRGREDERIRALDGFTLEDSEVYLNHVLAEDLPNAPSSQRRRLLLGLRYTDSAGKVWMQATAGWTKGCGRGRVTYFMPGHSEREFRDERYARILLNAITE